MATILFDDKADALVFGEDAVYETLASDNFIGGSAAAVSSGSLHFTFSGIAISLFGCMDPNDSSSPSATSTWSVPEPNIKQIYMDGLLIDSNVTFFNQFAIGLIHQSRQLPDTKHILTLSDVSSTILDFIEVTAGDTTPLFGSTLLLKSNDPALSYEGNWTHNDSILVDDAHQYRQPIGGATRDTSFSDASVTVSFTGTSISVLGTHDSDAQAQYSPTFHIDGEQRFYQPSHRSGPNYPWFSSQQLSNGEHVLKIDLSGNTTGAHFSLEYIIYTASPENLDTSSHPVPASVFIGVGVGLGVVVIGILLAILICLKKRKSKRQSSHPTVASTDTPRLHYPMHRNHNPTQASARQNEARSMKNGYMPRIDHSTRVIGLSHDQEQQITKALVPLPSPRGKKFQSSSNRSLTETSLQIRQLQQMVIQLQHDISLPDLAITSQNFHHDLDADISQDIINGTRMGIAHDELMAEGSYGMGVQQLEELMRELGEGTAHLDLGDQVGTGHSTTLAGLMEEILVSHRNQSRGDDKSPPPRRNVD